MPPVGSPRRSVLRTLPRRPGFWIALVLLVAVAAVTIVRARGPIVRTVLAERRDLEQHLVASGRVRVPTRVEIAAQLPGLVVAVGAVAGQRVAQGELLVQLDDATERASVAQAEAAVRQAQARVDQLRRVGAIVATESLRQIETTLADARRDRDRTSKLVEAGALPGVELEKAQRAVDIAEAQKTAAQAQQLASAPTGADSRVALTALLQAQAQLAGARARLAQTRIVALQSGTVLARDVEPGDVVQASRMLLELAADSAVELVFDPDERNLAWIRVGQRAVASADAFPQHVFDARVGYIAPSVDPQRGTVEVRLDVPEPPPFLKPDMTVSIDLTLATRPDALTVPSDVVRGVATATPWVQLVERGRLVRRDVELGIRGDGAIEVTAGLDERSEVVVPDGRQLAAGARVRTERR